MIQPGDVVIVEFPGVTGVKRRPSIVVSTDVYHRTRPDVVLGLITSQLPSVIQPSDHVLVDWQQAGLRKKSTFRTFLVTMPAIGVLTIGHVSDGDWQGIQGCLRRSLDFGVHSP